MPRFKQGYVLEPESYWRPAYRISPFNTSFIRKNQALLKNRTINEELIRHFFGPCFITCQNGKQAINIALRQFELKPNDEVWIITTSGNRYISSCVTKEIEKFCKWSMQQSHNTRLIFLNHEFGFCYKEYEVLKKFGLPVIEDRALSFASQDEARTTGTIGDMVVYSLPKFFPINFGGVLQVNNQALYPKDIKPDAELLLMFNFLMSYYLADVERIGRTRKQNFFYLEKMFSQLQFSPRFQPAANEVPGVFMFNCKNVQLDLMKKHFQENGVEASVFYGEDAFFIPVHQELSKEDLDFFYLLAADFVENDNQ